ncbi:hypothetical protein ABPG75_013961 [Micractinium tetrahymenae]
MEAHLQQTQQQLQDCQYERAELRGKVRRLEMLLASAQRDRAELEAQLASAQRARADLEAQLEAARSNKCQRDSADAEAVGAEVAKLEMRLAGCQAELHKCLAEEAKRQEAEKRRSSGGSAAAPAAAAAAAVGPQQPQPQQQQQAEGPPAEGAAEGDAGSGGAAATAQEPAAGGLAPGGSGATPAAPSSALGEGRIERSPCTQRLCDAEDAGGALPAAHVARNAPAGRAV